MKQQKDTIKRYIQILEYITIGWNTFEGILTLYLGILASSISLIAFGLSSGLEVFAGAVVLWEITQSDRTNEKFALKLIGTGYFIVATYTLWNAVRDLLYQHHSRSSPLGIIFLLVTVFIMLTLAYIKTKAGKKLRSATVLAEANYSLIDGSLAAAVLIGLVLDMIFGIWWADELLAIIIALFAVKEGTEEWSK